MPQHTFGPYSSEVLTKISERIVAVQEEVTCFIGTLPLNV